jgi:predicted lipase
MAAHVHAQVVSITPKFDEEVGKSMANIVAVSYCSDATAVMSWQCERCQRVPSFVPHSTFEDDKKALFAFSGFYTGQIVVAFKGSDAHSLDDWVANLQAYSKLNATDWGSDVMVHAGFFDLYQRIRSNITASIRALLEQHPGASIVTTGHSLGGALAYLCAIDTSHLLPNVSISSMTFGSPR